MEDGKQVGVGPGPGTSDAWHSNCPARQVLDHVTSRWGVWVLMALLEGDLRFSELRERVEGISEKMLSQTLRTLVRDGLAWRAVEPSTPPRVTYGLTPLGRGTGEQLASLFAWIRGNATDILDTQADYDRAHAQ